MGKQKSKSKVKKVKKFKRGRGRPKGSLNKKGRCPVAEKIKRKRGRPKGSLNLKTLQGLTSDNKTLPIKKQFIKQLETEILNNVDTDIEIEVENEKSTTSDLLNRVLFGIPEVDVPLIGTPKEAQKELDGLAKKMQRDLNNNEIFNKIHLYMHGYLVNVVLRKFPFIKGSQTVDIYQETLMALRFKAIPNFKSGKGMSFLNFAKMCIRRHLITLLHASRNRNKDKAMNCAVSLDSSPIDDDSEGKNTLANIISDNKVSHDKIYANTEAYNKTKSTLMKDLSHFERVVMEEYLANSSYREIARNISLIFKEKHNAKSIDNALLRIRKKAIHMKKFCKCDDLPIFIEKKNDLK